MATPGPGWTGGRHLHVAVHGVDPDHIDAFAADLETRVGQLLGVAWAALDTGCSRLVVAGESFAGPDKDAVLAALKTAEAAAGASGPFATLVAEHPADRIGAARYTLEVAADVDAAMVATVVLADAGIGAVQQFRAERAIAALDRTAAQQVRVRRDGADQVVPAADLVVGDVVYLAAGAGTPADCRLVDADSLETDESSLTGESLPVAKTPAPSDAVALVERTCMLYAGTAVAAG
jgi:magnesium-transporting ATPase (P-type)